MDRRYFARPARSLFMEVRDHFALADQARVYRVIERYVELAEDFIVQLPGDIGLDGQPRQCRASTRKGKPCQRVPLPGRDHCPSHKHLEEVLEPLGALEPGALEPGALEPGALEPVGAAA